MNRSEKAGVVELREPGVRQGLVLIALAWVAPAAAVVIAPVLPTIAREFRQVPAADVKIALIATGPALLVALLAVPYGFLADRIGRRDVLLAALFVYGAVGMAPLLLRSLDAIVASRFAVGLAEAAVMTCSTTLIGDYFHGRRRERWLAAQAGLAPLAAVCLVSLGGTLGAFGWRAPFFVYAWGWILIVPVLVLLREPRPLPRADHEGMVAPTATLFGWGKPIGIAIVVMFSMIAFMVTVVQFSFLVTERGLTAPASIGLWSALITLGNPAGSLIFSLTKGRPAAKLGLAYALFAAGFCFMSMVPTVPAAIAGGFIANLGAGIVLPTAITWLLSSVPAAMRGRGSGLFTAANFLGQFLGPLTVLALVKTTGSLSEAILAVGIACALAAGVTIVIAVRNRKNRAIPEMT
jgi:MFS family permease